MNTVLSICTFAAFFPFVSVVNGQEYLISITPSANFISDQPGLGNEALLVETPVGVAFSSKPEQIFALPSEHFEALVDISYARYIEGVEDLLHAYLRHVGVNIEGIEGHTAFYYEKGRTLTELYVDPRNEIICEVGYNAGHSSLNALLAKTNSRVVSFDLGMHRERYGQHSFDVLSHFFPERLELLLGDSTVTVPQFINERPETKCNVILIDGGHTKEIAAADIANFANLANRTHHVLVVDDTENVDVLAAYSEARETGLVAHSHTVNACYIDVFNMEIISGYGDEISRLVPHQCKENNPNSTLSIGHYAFKDDEKGSEL